MLRKVFIALSTNKRLARFMTESRLAWLAARRFVAGQSLDEAIEVVRELNQVGLLVTFDHLGENVANRAEAEAATDTYLEAIDRIRRSQVKSGISVKLTAIGLDLGDEVAEANMRRILERAEAAEPQVFVRIDMEGSAYTQRTFDIFYRLRADHRRVGIVVQSYLYRTADDVERLIELGSGPRLCKGAYLEPEEIAWPDKKDVDASYIRLCERLFSDEARQQGVYPAIATHDEAIIDWVKAHVARRGIGPEDFEFQMLYGVRRDLQQQLVEQGYQMRVYVPYGSQWYPYYMRRLAERPENLGFILRSMLSELKPGRPG